MNIFSGHFPFLSETGTRVTTGEKAEEERLRAEEREVSGSGSGLRKYRVLASDIAGPSELSDVN